MAQARSIYRQVRFTVSEQQGGLLVFRVLAKPLDADWRTQHSVAHGIFRTGQSTTHWSELLQVAIEECLAQRLFPDD